MKKERIILGVDPGTSIMGFGLIKTYGKNMEFIQMNELHLKKYINSYNRLKVIFNRTIEIIETYNPDEMALEAPFYGKNIQSMLKIGRAQGVAMAAGLSREISITEYAPSRIKQAITGKGNASKEQVALMLKSVLNIKQLPKNLDSTDGLAVAVCHFYSNVDKNTNKSYRDWDSFIRQNKNRVKQ